MFLGTENETTEHIRRSKLGKEHRYNRVKTIVKLRCDNCDSVFTRDLKKINRVRLSNEYFHVCSNCDSKRFAQRKGVEQKQIWDIPAGSDLPISKY
jgi:Zn finger protein HypA/HybF involved in hydrogenase expression